MAGEGQDWFWSAEILLQDRFGWFFYIFLILFRIYSILFMFKTNWYLFYLCRMLLGKYEVKLWATSRWLLKHLQSTIYDLPPTSTSTIYNLPSTSTFTNNIYNLHQHDIMAIMTIIMTIIIIIVMIVTIQKKIKIPSVFAQLSNSPLGVNT